MHSSYTPSVSTGSGYASAKARTVREALSMLGLTEETDTTTRGSKGRPLPPSHANPYADSPLLPVKHEIKGTDPNSVILFTNVQVLDSTGREPFPADVLIRGERIAEIAPKIDQQKVRKNNPYLRIIDGKGRTLMSGLCDAHTHFTWNNSGNLEALGELPVEEHTIFTIRAARTYLDYGYTMCFGAASAKARLDCVIRDAINAGDIAGPRYLANAQEIARRDGALVESISAFADGPEEMRIAALKGVALGADQIKLSMSGESITETVMAEDNFYTDEETRAACEAAHENGKRVCSHARGADSIKMSVRWGVDVIYHASFADEEALNMLEAKKDKLWVAPAINWITQTLTEAGDYGYSPSKAEAVGYKVELDEAIKSMKAMKKRGIKILPGGDYGFAWTPHGTLSSRQLRAVEISSCGRTNLEKSYLDTMQISSWWMATRWTIFASFKIKADYIISLSMDGSTNVSAVNQCLSPYG